MMSPRWQAIGTSQFPWKQEALELLQQGLPDIPPNSDFCVSFLTTNARPVLNTPACTQTGAVTQRVGQSSTICLSLLSSPARLPLEEKIMKQQDEKRSRSQNQKRGKTVQREWIGRGKSKSQAKAAPVVVAETTCAFN